MKKRATYICIEGTEGVGKSTQSKKLEAYLLSKKFKVLKTQEPGSAMAPVTMELRKLMLDNDFDKDLTLTSREFISQASRSVSLEKIIMPALKEKDFIIQDRGLISALSYGKACGNKTKFLKKLCSYLVNHSGIGKKYTDLYDHVIILKGDTNKGLKNAKNAKQEFKKGDAMESRGNKFMEDVERYMLKFSKKFKKVSVIYVDGKDIEEVFAEIKKTLNI